MVINKIALSGKANSGKDTVGNFIRQILQENQDANPAKFAFADPMKKIILEMFPQLNPEFLFGPSKLRNTIIPGAFTEDEQPLTIRQLLLDLGKFGRKYSVDIWINATISNVENHLNQSGMPIGIITDVRFTNEFYKLRDSGFKVIRIIRPGNDVNINDISEIDMDQVPNSQFDEIIVNNGSLPDLKAAVANFVKRHLL